MISILPHKTSASLHGGACHELAKTWDRCFFPCARQLEACSVNPSPACRAWRHAARGAGTHRLPGRSTAVPAAGLLWVRFAADSVVSNITSDSLRSLNSVVGASGELFTSFSPSDAAALSRRAPPGAPMMPMMPGQPPGQPPVQPPAQPQPPRKDASDWAEHKAADGRVYFHNKTSGQSSWEKPKELMTALERADASTPWREHTAPDGRKYFYNKETKESKWSVPADLQAARDAALRAEAALTGVTPSELLASEAAGAAANAASASTAERVRTGAASIVVAKPDAAPAGPAAPMPVTNVRAATEVPKVAPGNAPPLSDEYLNLTKEEAKQAFKDMLASVRTRDHASHAPAAAPRQPASTRLRVSTLLRSLLSSPHLTSPSVLFVSPHLTAQRREHNELGENSEAHRHRPAVRSAQDSGG